MRNGPNNNKRMRSRNNNNNNNNNNNRRGQNPMTRVFESNGPDIKIRGTASHVAEKYVQLARDARSSGDPVAAENYYQHAEHYFRLIAAAQEQFRQNQPQQQPMPRQDGDALDDNSDDSDSYSNFGAEPALCRRNSSSRSSSRASPSRIRANSISRASRTSVIAISVRSLRHSPPKAIRWIGFHPSLRVEPSRNRTEPAPKATAIRAASASVIAAGVGRLARVLKVRPASLRAKISIQPANKRNR